jgi:hypothetical protein
MSGAVRGNLIEVAITQHVTRSRYKLRDSFAGR